MTPADLAALKILGWACLGSIVWTMICSKLKWDVTDIPLIIIVVCLVLALLGLLSYAVLAALGFVS